MIHGHLSRGPRKKLSHSGTGKFLAKTFDRAIWYLLVVLPFIKSVIIWQLTRVFPLWQLAHVYLRQGLDPQRMLRRKRIKEPDSTRTKYARHLIHVIFGWAIALNFFIFTLDGSVMFEMLTFDPKWSLINTWDEFVAFSETLTADRRWCLRIVSSELAPLYNYYEEMQGKENFMPVTRRKMLPMVQYYNPFELDSIPIAVKCCAENSGGMLQFQWLV